MPPKPRTLDRGSWEVKDTLVILHPHDPKRVDRWMLINRNLGGISLRACVGDNLRYQMLPETPLDREPR